MHVPIAKPSDLLYSRALADGSIEVELIEAERRFFCVYKYMHGIKFQASRLFTAGASCLMQADAFVQVVCLPNGLIGNLAGSTSLFQFTS